MQICSSCFPKRELVSEAYDGEADSRLEEKRSREEELQTRFYCCGRITPQSLHRKRHGMLDDQNVSVKSGSSVELAVEAYESECAVSQILNPVSFKGRFYEEYLSYLQDLLNHFTNWPFTKAHSEDSDGIQVNNEVPYIENLPGELYQGRAIEIQGKLLENAQRFSVNLSTGKDNDSDLALHFNPRVDRHVVIRNHRIKNKWGVEEITSLQHFPFTVGRNFSVLIFVADEQFLISVNKIHYCAFAFRIPIDKIKSLIILGDISLSGVLHNDRNHYPPRIFKKTPYIIVPRTLKSDNNKCNFRRKIKSIKPGSTIDIFGRIKILPRAFYVNLQNGITLWPHPIIPFHMNYRLHPPGTHKREREIIFNSWLNGFWGKEEIITFCPFLPGTDFHLKIVCKTDGFKVFANDKYIFNFNKRDETDIDSVVIHGDVVINKVILH